MGRRSDAHAAEATSAIKATTVTARLRIDAVRLRVFDEEYSGRLVDDGDERIPALATDNKYPEHERSYEEAGHWQL